MISKIGSVTKFKLSMNGKWGRAGPEVEMSRTGNRTTDPNPAVPNSTRECWSVFQHWLHLSPFFLKWTDTNNRIWNLLTWTLFNMIRRSSNDTTHYINCAWQCYSAMVISYRSLFFATMQAVCLLQALWSRCSLVLWGGGSANRQPSKIFTASFGATLLPLLTLCSVFVCPGCVLWCNGIIIILSMWCSRRHIHTEYFNAKHFFYLKQQNIKIFMVCVN